MNTCILVPCLPQHDACHSHCVTAFTPVETCSSCRCAVTQHQCTATQALVKCAPYCPVLLCKTVSQQALCHCRYTYEGLLLIQVCSDPTPVHCSTGFGKMHPPLFSGALQNSLTACMCHCKYTSEGLLLIQVCSDPAPMHCNTGFGKMHLPLSSAALQHRLTACLCHCIYTCGDLLFMQVCSDPTPMHCNTGFGKMHCLLSSAALHNRLTSGTVSLQIHLLRFAAHAGAQ